MIAKFVSLILDYRLRVTGVLILLLMITLVCDSPVLANGGKAKAFRLTGSLTGTGNEVWTFDAEGDPVTFYLATLNNKYHVFAIRAESQAKSPLKLSRNEDTIEIRFGSRSVNGVLNIASIDPQTWDGLGDTMRAEIAYPPSIPSGEEEGIYIYVPTGDLKNQRERFAVPDSITYMVKSVGKKIVLVRPVAPR